MNNMKGKTPFLFIFVLIAALDQLTKFLVSSEMHLFERIEVIPGFFHILYIRNSGVVWGLLSSGSGSLIQKLITLLSIIALGAVAWFFIRLPRHCRMELTGLSLVAGGAAGNLADRILHGSVVDFLHFSVGAWAWPTFNVADSAITIGVLLLALSLWRGKCASKKA